MKKIMFNDKYRLTQAVLEGRKTQTRRIAYIGSLPRLDFGICVKPKNFGRATFSYGGVNIPFALLHWRGSRRSTSIQRICK